MERPSQSLLPVINSIAKSLLPTLVTETHKPLIESCDIQIEDDQIVLTYSKDLHEDIFLGKWDLAEAIGWLDLPDRVIFRIKGGRDLQLSVASLKHQARIQFEQLTKMRRTVMTTEAQLERFTLLPESFGKISLINYVNTSNDRIVLVLEDTQSPIAVSPAYGEWTERDPMDWIGDNQNKARWIGSELLRMQEALEDPGNKGILRGFEYTANFWRDNSPCVWIANIERIDLNRLCCKDNAPAKPPKWARLVHYLHREPKMSQV